MAQITGCIDEKVLSGRWIRLVGSSKQFAEQFKWNSFKKLLVSFVSGND